MRVFLKWVSGRDAGVLDLEGDDSLVIVRIKVAGICQVHPSLQVLVYKNAELKESDEKSVREYGIAMDEDLRVKSRPQPVVIHLSVGGTRHSTLLSTLLKVPASLLAKMFDGLEFRYDDHGIAGGVPGGISTVLVPRDPADGTFFIDRHGPSFEFILTFLRDGTESSLPSQPERLRQLAVEAAYFRLDELVARCEAAAGCTVKSLQNLVDECGGPTTAADVAALSDEEVTQLLQEHTVNVLFAKRIREEVAAERERVRQKAEEEAARLAAEAATRLAVANMSSGLARLGAANVTESGVLALVASGHDLYSVCQLDVARAQALGLSEEDAREVGGIVNQSVSIKWCDLPAKGARAALVADRRVLCVRCQLGRWRRLGRRRHSICRGCRRVCVGRRSGGCTFALLCRGGCGRHEPGERHRWWIPGWRRKYRRFRTTVFASTWRRRRRIQWCLRGRGISSIRHCYRRWGRGRREWQ